MGYKAPEWPRAPAGLDDWHKAQIDFGERFVTIAGEETKVYLFVPTFGASLRNYVRTWRGAFRQFGGVAEVVPLDNSKPLVRSRDVETREAVFYERF